MIRTEFGEPLQTEPTANTYFPAFDYLRGVLAFTVMLSHQGVVTWHYGGVLPVQVFFALSGWLIGGILIHTPPKGLPRFYFNRAVRIWVPYYISLAALLTVSFFRDHITSKWAEIVLYLISFVFDPFGTDQVAMHVQEMPLSGTGLYFWSVNVEEQFYLLAPFLLVLPAHRFGRSVLVWVIIAAVAWIYHTWASLALGVLAAVVVHHCGAIHTTNYARVALACATCATAIGMGAGLSFEFLSPIFAISLVLLLAFTGTKTLLGAVIGGMSYPLYLNHWIGVFAGHFLLRPFDLRDSILFHFLSVAISLAIAVAHYWYIDRQLLAMRPNIFSVRRALIATYSAYTLVGAGLIFGFAMRAH